MYPYTRRRDNYMFCTPAYLRTPQYTSGASEGVYSESSAHVLASLLIQVTRDQSRMRRIMLEWTKTPLRASSQRTHTPLLLTRTASRVALHTRTVTNQRKRVVSVSSRILRNSSGTSVARPSLIQYLYDFLLAFATMPIAVALSASRTGLRLYLFAEQFPIDESLLTREELDVCARLCAHVPAWCQRATVDGLYQHEILYANDHVNDAVLNRLERMRLLFTFCDACFSLCPPQRANTLRGCLEAACMRAAYHPAAVTACLSDDMLRLAYHIRVST